MKYRLYDRIFNFTFQVKISEGRRTTTKVEKDSVVFEENELGKAPDG